uniref:Uncharacterized protein n=1 Tax=Rhizophora mucronata TaxID=61149 RepID=A0A2P2PXK4_RHIMU
MENNLCELTTYRFTKLNRIEITFYLKKDTESTEI